MSKNYEQLELMTSFRAGITDELNESSWDSQYSWADNQLTIDADSANYTLSCRMGNVICPQISGQLSANLAELGYQHKMDSAIFCRTMGPRAAETLNKMILRPECAPKSLRELLPDITAIFRMRT